MKTSLPKVVPLVGAIVLSTLALGGAPASADNGYQLCIAETPDDDVYRKNLIIAAGDIDCTKLRLNYSGDDKFQRWNYCTADYSQPCNQVLNDILNNLDSSYKWYGVVVSDLNVDDRCIHDDFEDGTFDVESICMRST